MRRPQPLRLPETIWHVYRTAPAGPADLDSRVHVWRAGLERRPDEAGSSLSDEERARADRFHRSEDRDRFVAAREFLRQILADCLGRADDPKGRTLRFLYGAAGKPSLAGHPGLHFNVSHAGQLILVAATRAGDVGIDIETDRPMKDMDAIAAQAFDRAERDMLAGAPHALRSTIFYRIWTRKEALLKADGTGLSGLGNPEAASLTNIRPIWSVISLPHLDGYVASLAHRPGLAAPKLWSLPNAASLRPGERRRSPRSLPAASYGADAFEARP